MVKTRSMKRRREEEEEEPPGPEVLQVQSSSSETEDVEDEEEEESSVRENGSRNGKGRSSGSGKKNGSLKRSSSGKRKKGLTNGSVSILSYFARKDGGKDPPKCPKSPESKKRILSPETRAFLHSGVPEVVIKAQKVVEKKRAEDESLATLGFFPKIQSQEKIIINNSAESVTGLSEEEEEKESESSWSLTPLSKENLSLVRAEERDHELLSKRQGICCRHLADLSIPSTVSESRSALPWISEFPVPSLEALCCDKEALSKLRVWLKQWKSDIKDDGGTSRKVELKRKRRDSDSDFLTSEEECDEMKKKSVLLTGPTGCGKTTAVYVIAKHYGFHVVEVNFSSKRTGKDVMQKVEEAVLSHRLESQKNCLLLFEDIDLVHPQDEGFHSAVAQLITTAVRPIVMTSTTVPGTSWSTTSLDPKLEKKDPLVIPFKYPRPEKIVKKVLTPLVTQKLELEDRENSRLLPKLKALLEAVCRHGRNDVRQILNQVQFLFTSEGQELSNISLHKHSLQSFCLLDQKFLRTSNSERNQESSCQGCDDDEEEEESEINLSAKARKRKLLQRLSGTSALLELLCDLDLASSVRSVHEKNQPEIEDALPLQIRALKSSYMDPSFVESFSMQQDGRPDLSRLILDSEAELGNYQKGLSLYNEIGDYCEGWESASFVRTIMKRNMLESLSQSRYKRNGRATFYFNRIRQDRSLSDKIFSSFNFQRELDEARIKEASLPYNYNGLLL